jgi:hypothetical protein
MSTRENRIVDENSAARPQFLDFGPREVQSFKFKVENSEGGADPMNQDKKRVAMRPPILEITPARWFNGSRALISEVD